MLVLTRKVEEQILIGDDVIITVLGFMGGKVKLGISAPPEVIVDRPEVRDRREAERRLEEGER